MLLPGSSFQRRVRRALLPLSAFMVVLVGRAQPDDRAITWPEDYFPELKTILATALKQSPQVLLKEIEVAQHDARVYGATSQRLPNIGADARYAVVETAISSNTDRRSRDQGLFYNVSASQPIFHWGALNNNVALARLRVALAEKNYAEAARALAVALRGSYLALIARKASLVHVRHAVNLRRADLELAREKLTAGTLASGEVGSRELDYHEARTALERNEIEFAAERKQFGRLAGIGDIAEDAIPATIPKPSYSEQAAARLVASVLRDEGKNFFEVRVAQMHVEEAELNYRIQKVRLLPKFNVSIGFRLENNTNATQAFVTQTGVAQRSAEINVRWNIFDGLATRGAKLEALADKRLWQEQREQAKDRVLDEIQRQARSLKLDAEDMGYAQTRLDVAESQLARVREEVKLGNMPQSAIELATRDVRQAEYRSALTRATFLSNWSAFVSLVGEDPVVNQIPSRYVREK